MYWETSVLSEELPPCLKLGNEKTPWGLGQVPGLAGRVDQTLPLCFKASLAEGWLGGPGQQ